jgi:hypothetical protein
VAAEVPFEEAVTTAVPLVEPTTTEAEKPAVLEPAATLTLAGAVTAVLFDVNVATSPPAGAFPESVTVHALEPDTAKLDGAQLTVLMLTRGAEDGLMAATAMELPPPSTPSVEPMVTPLCVPGTTTVAITPSGIDPVLTAYAIHEYIDPVPLHVSELFEDVTAAPGADVTPLAPEGIVTIHCRAEGALPVLAKETLKVVLPPARVPAESVREGCAERRPQVVSNARSNIADDCKYGVKDLITLNSSTPELSGLNVCGLRFSLRLFCGGLRKEP